MFIASFGCELLGKVGNYADADADADVDPNRANTIAKFSGKYS